MTRTNPLAETFALLEKAAIAGARCPQNAPHGPLFSCDTTALARAGRIRIDVYLHNYRVVTILVGPNAGKQTAPPPRTQREKSIGYEPRPYKVVGLKTFVNGREEESHVTRSNRIGPSLPRTFGLRDLKEGGR